MPMGLNLKGFGRRKSAGNILDADADSATPKSSFRVLDRPDKASDGTERDLFDSPTITRPFTSPLHELRGKSVDNLALSQSKQTNERSLLPNRQLNGPRGSAGTTASGSTGFYDSPSTSLRHSSTSTLPSSLEQDREAHASHRPRPPRDEQDEDEDSNLFANRNPVANTLHKSAAVSAVAGSEEPIPPPPSFGARAVRAFSFGRSVRPPTAKDIPPVPAPPSRSGDRSAPSSNNQSPSRDRAMTTSSYASTTRPTRAELTLSTSDFGKDLLGKMFDTIQPDDASAPGSDQNLKPPARMPLRTSIISSPKFLSGKRGDLASPISSDSAASPVSVSSSEQTENNTTGGLVQAILGNSKSRGYEPVSAGTTSPDPIDLPPMKPFSSTSRPASRQKEGIPFAGDREPRTGIPGQVQNAYPNRQQHIDDDEEDYSWVRRVELQDPQASSSHSFSKPTPSHARRVASPEHSPPRVPHSESRDTTPRAGRPLTEDFSNEPLFDTVVRPRANLSASRSSSGQAAPPGEMTTAVKKMTKAEFQRLKSGADVDTETLDGEEEPGADELDDDDDIERARKMANQRRKQEANMAVYRQQMKRVTGGGLTDLPSAQPVRPPIDRNASAPAATGGSSLYLGGMAATPPIDSHRARPSVEDGDADEDIPLGILQAHGFPSTSRPPTRTGGNDLMHARRTSNTGSVYGGGPATGGVPAFARRLPADPYFGAGLVNHTNRESLAFSSAGSVAGGHTPVMAQTPSGHPGGLVGVIAGEERARAARRGSVNPATAFGFSPSPSPYSMSNRAMSMTNLAMPSVYAPSGTPMGASQMPAMAQMPLMQQPGDAQQQQQMQQFMQMQMQVMQNMLQMQQAQLGQGMMSPPGPPHTPDFLGASLGHSRPVSIVGQVPGFPVNMPSQGRAMTMAGPPPEWNTNAQSARPQSGVAGAFNTLSGELGPDYTPSIAPSERSNVGMPSRYRPVSTANLAGPGNRTSSMTSAMTLQAFARQQMPSNVAGTPYNGDALQVPRPPTRASVVSQQRPAARANARAVEEDEDDGWAQMRKTREEKKKRFRWGGHKSRASELPLEDVYKTVS